MHKHSPLTGVVSAISIACYWGCGNLQWLTVGGTSLSSPALAGVVNSAGAFSSSSAAENAMIYTNMGHVNQFRDITAGQAGTHQATVGWDFVTGVGSDIGKGGK